MSEYLEFWLARMIAETIWAIGIIVALVVLLLVIYGGCVLWDKWDAIKRQRRR